MKHKNPHKRVRITWFLLGLGTLLIVLLSLLIGGTTLTPLDAVRALFGHGDRTSVIIMQQIRLPRTLAGLLSGIGLSVSGVLLQTVTDNSLASPNLIGVNSGAGFAAILLLAWFPSSLHLLPFAAFVGAFATTVLIVCTAGRIGFSKTTVILAGVAMTSVLNAAISLISTLNPDVLTSYNDFSVGGLSGISMERLGIPAILITLALCAALLLARPLETLRLGDETASALGIRVRLLRLIALLCASASAAAVVCFAGLLGFVGLIVPHLARRLVGERMTALLPASALAGGSLVVLADTLGRTLFSPGELPVGILLSLIGAPFFLFLLFRRSRYA